MKRTLALVLILALICLGLPGCGRKAAGPLRVVLDVEEETRYSRTAGVVEELLEEIAGEGGPSDVEVEYLPRTGTERKNAITHLRTEIMAGSGPDLFIISGSGPSGEREDGPLFPFPEKSAVNGLFMPLDDYIEKARHAMWDSFNQTIMEAGRTERGQMLVPLSYTFPITCFPRMEVSHSHSKELTWDDMLADESGIMLASAALERGSGKNMIAALDGPDFNAIFGKTADYKREELLFSQEELLEYTQKQLELDAVDPERFAQLPKYFHTRANQWFYGGGETEGHVQPYISSGDPLTVIPQYNKNGGVTATVYSFACINANTRRREDAFFILDYILSRGSAFKDIEGANAAMSSYSARQDFYSLFTDADGLHIDSGISFDSVYEGSITEENRTAIDAAMRCVTAVNVYGKLNRELDWMMEDCREAGGDIERIVKEAYRVMDMELKES